MTRKFSRIYPFLLFVLLLNFSLPIKAANYKELVPPGLTHGAGVWANIWNYPQGDLDAYCLQLKANGISNLFLQTSRSNTEAIKRPQELGNIIEACHRHQIRVIAWSFALLLNPVADADKMVAAAQFQSPHGETIDAIAPNLEQNLSATRVETYFKHLREKLGKTYPIMAVVYSPLNRSPEVAHTPWKVLAQYADVLAPMAYWNSKYQKYDAYEYTVSTLQQVRALTEKSDVELHIIGDGMGTDSAAIQSFLKGCQAGGATSASLYPNFKATDEQLAALACYKDYFPSNSLFRLAAFRELVRANKIDAVPKHDPSQLVSHGDFYKLVVKQFHLADKKATTNNDKIKQEVTAESAHQTLVSCQLLENMDASELSKHLAEPICYDNAVGLVSQVIDRAKAKSQAASQNKNHKVAHHPAKWFSMPAMAANQSNATSSQQQYYVNFLDASALVLTAGSAF